MKIELDDAAENTKKVKNSEQEEIVSDNTSEKKSIWQTFLDKPFMKKLRYFWDYYKWFAIIPFIIIVIAVAFYNDYTMENKPRLLDVVLVNTSDISIPYVEIGQNYSVYRGYAEGELPVKITANITYPKVMNERMAQDTALVSGIQKLQAMFLSGKINVMISTDYAVNDFAGADDFIVLTEYLEPEFIEKHKERLFYAKMEDGTEKPVGFYLEDNEKLGTFNDDEVPVIAICSFSEEEKILESIEFLKWMMMQY